jgi:hypothetical protein
MFFGSPYWQMIVLQYDALFESNIFFLIHLTNLLQPHLNPSNAFLLFNFCNKLKSRYVYL